MLKRFVLSALALLGFHSIAAAQTVQMPIDPQTVAVVITTSMGEITVEVDVERAPITANNFLKYADDKRFDGTVFYRAMQLNWGEPPNGMIQGGTQNDPKRILPPIQHEPTNETGLSHLRGAISMARWDPGTATGDFTIMLSTQKGMDAQPDSDDESLKPGYAAFGYVTKGMDVVESIFNAPIDPDKGEGWMKGQLLADPVTIITVRRAKVPAEMAE